MPVQFSIVAQNGNKFLMAYDPEADTPFVAGADHPNYATIERIALAGELAEHDLAELFDVEAAVAARFNPLSERVSVRDGRIYLDGDAVDNSLTRQAIRFLEDGVEDWRPLVAFYEKVLANPVEHSREQLYDWLNSRDFALTYDGDIIAYKGVTAKDDGLYSGHAGHAIVDGEEVNGYIPNAIGSTVEMPRSEVTHDPSLACHSGLHVGTRGYARGFAHPTILEVHVNPRDVVSVPTGDAEKVRVCRYDIYAESEAERTSPVSFGGYHAPIIDACDECGEALLAAGDCPECGF